MRLPRQSKTRPSEDATAKTYGRAKCKNCDQRFIKLRPNQEFCKFKKDGTASNCKNEFHRNRSAFGPLKGKIEGMIREHTKERHQGYKNALLTLTGSVNAITEALLKLEMRLEELERRGRQQEGPQDRTAHASHGQPLPDAPTRS
jgi:hypothetical protein